MAQSCGFQAKRDQIRDRFLVGVRDTGLIEKLALETDQDLDHLISHAKKYEAVKKAVKDKVEEQKRVDALRWSKPNPQSNRHHNNYRQANMQNKLQWRRNRQQGEHLQTNPQGRNQQAPESSHGIYTNQSHPQINRNQGHATWEAAGNRTCNFCGMMHRLGRNNCPAYGKTCTRCNKRNHFPEVCRSAGPPQVAAVQEVEASDEHASPDAYLGLVEEMSHDKLNNETDKAEISALEDDKNSGMVKLKIGKGEEQIWMKIDTGADVSVVSYETLKKLNLTKHMQETDIKLNSPGGKVDVIGKVTTEIRTPRAKVEDVVLYATRNPIRPLLGREDSMKLGLVKLLNEVNVPEGMFAKEVGLWQTTPVSITLKEGAAPYAVATARRVSLPLYQPVKEELGRLESAGIIEKVTEPTDWCAPIVPVPKPGGKVRLTVDFKKLNASVKRERYELPTFVELSTAVQGSDTFSKLDATSGFFHLPLSEESKHLTTFLTPFGRYRFNRLPMGITLAPEVYQRKMAEMLDGLPGVVFFQDDIIVHGKGTEHDKRPSAVLNRIKETGIKLNESKCEFRRQSVSFLGHRLSAAGVQPDKDKIRAVQDMPPPENVHELRTLLGVINFLTRFVPNAQTVLGPMHDLLKKDVTWVWDHPQQKAFKDIKQKIAEAGVLAYFDTKLETLVSADASSYGIGGCLMQKGQDGELRPVAFCSRRLTSAESRYAQIEKEYLAAAWACEKFHGYLYGLQRFSLLTDHKPLVPLINSRNIADAPLRCQRLLMRLAAYAGDAIYTPGKQLIIADLLSRKPVSEQPPADTDVADIEAHVNAIISALPASKGKLEDFAQRQHQDRRIQQVKEFTGNGWPSSVPPDLLEFYAARGYLSTSYD